MKRRIIAAVAAVLLAAVGSAGLYSYVRGADQRAMAGLQPVQVLVVSAPVAKGTPIDQLSKQVTNKTLPAVAVAPDAVSSIDQLSGLVATVDLQPGEQVIASRFADPSALIGAQSAPVPAGLQELSLQLDSQRVLGGNLAPGDTVGMFFSVKEQTQLVLHQVLVSRVQGGLEAAPSSEQAGDKPAPMPEGSVMVTFAVTAPQAEKIVFAAENGSVWLSREPVGTDQRGTGIVTERSVFK